MIRREGWTGAPRGNLDWTANEKAKPTTTGILGEIVRWIKHFEAAKLDPIHLIELGAGSLDVTQWWYEFLVEIEQINDDDSVFKRDKYTST